jgi:catalase-peroxidase
VFATAWFKLTHRDMGPYSRGLGSLVPAEPYLWQDPVPEVTHELITATDITLLKSKIVSSELSVSQLVQTAWASASTFRGTDKRGGANGARIQLEPQKNWEVNNPKELSSVLSILKTIQSEFNSSQTGNKSVSLADIIVLAGCAGVEKAIKNAGQDFEVPFIPGRTDASQQQTDVESFAVLEPTADGFRNFVGNNHGRLVGESLIDRAHMLTLTAPELTVLIGGMRVLNTNSDGTKHGVLTSKSETLCNDFFVNLIDLSTEWKVSSLSEGVYEGTDRATGDVKWTGTAVDLVFGSNSQLRAIAEVYASDDAKQLFVRDFVSAWDKVMNLDRFEIS